MLRHTFCHLKGVSRSAEEKLWSRGIMTWDDYERSRGGGVFSERKSRDVLSQLRESREALTRNDAAYFLERLPAADRVRVFPHFREQIGYLDIETTGLSSADEITTIALYDGRRVRTYVNGRNLADFPADVNARQLLVTFNGERFDLPFLRLAFREAFDQAHLDLRPVLAALGCRGGLKECERTLEVKRQVPRELDGAEAVRLWNRYAREGDELALSLLLAYNSQDALGLELLLVKAYSMLIRDLPLDFQRIPEPAQPQVWKPV